MMLVFLCMVLMIECCFEWNSTIYHIADFDDLNKIYSLKFEVTLSLRLHTLFLSLLLSLRVCVKTDCHSVFFSRLRRYTQWRHPHRPTQLLTHLDNEKKKIEAPNEMHSKDKIHFINSLSSFLFVFEYLSS